MTKYSLLTNEDIKNFIFQTIEQVLERPVVYLNATQLGKQLNLSIYKIKEYRKQGMPFIMPKRRALFNVEKVCKWLANQNLYDKELFIKTKGC